MEFNVKPLDCYLGGVSTAGVEPNRLISDIRAARADKIDLVLRSVDALNDACDHLRRRMDTFDPKPSGYRPNGDDKAEELAFR